VVANNCLYVIGGSVNAGASTKSGGYDISVHFAPILDGGQLGPWSETTPLPYPLVYIGNSCLSIGNTIYICGGNIHDDTQNIASPNVLMARVNPDGTLGSWTPSSNFPGPPAQACAAVHTDRHVYVLGGANDANQPQSIVYRAPLQPDGSLGPWVQDPSLPMPEWFHCAGLMMNRIYIWGGMRARRQNPMTFAAAIQADGSLGPWEQAGLLPINLSRSTGIAVNNFLMSFAGEDENKMQIPDVFFCEITRQGQGPWLKVLANVPLSRFGACAYDSRNNVIFLPGGRGYFEGKDTLLADVLGFRLVGDGESHGADYGRKEVSPSPQSPSAGAPASQISWLPYRDGFAQAQQTGRPLLVVFGSSQVPRSAVFWNEVVMHPDFAKVASRYVCSFVNIARDRTPAMELGVFRVPTVIVVRPPRQIQAKLMGDITLQQLLALP